MAGRGRSGREPRNARSPLRLRRALAIVTTAVCLAGGIAVLVADRSRGLGAFLLVAGALGATDVAIISWRLRHHET